MWSRPEQGARGPAAAYGRAELTAAAVDLADRRGLSAVSMRQVAGALGTGQASLYRHLSGRDDLLDLMTDAVTGEIALDVPLSGDPVADLLALARRTRTVHLRHPWLCEVPPEPLRLGPRGLDFLEYALAATAPAPLSGRARMEVVALTNALVSLFARTELEAHQGRTDRRAAQAAYLASAAETGGHPLVAAAMAEADADADVRALFERGMHRVLTGLLSR
ncbi:TetR/AcrR family transcriptional regulator [Streptomyces xiaopingdaonensis]|uniref:TetR/AcrR family transcriptional regulator n=1 Tax=Streptomyces xiaopingdaonensis TaxID=1565415 RepID=UPI00031C4CC4|nr:helix-turn-helix domain-containing protein [Streptomyces xiaopingdaonensis]